MSRPKQSTGDRESSARSTTAAGSGRHFLGESDGAQVEIPTPEGVPLRFAVATAGDRAKAFLLDGILIVIAVIVCNLALSLFFVVDEQAATALLLMFNFAWRNFYFSGLEILWRGRTLGKRLIGLQVIDRSGAPLRVEAIFARNLMRELEIFTPLTILIGGPIAMPWMPAWLRLGTLIWVGAFVLLPLLNRQRLRMGDLVAGTMVVRAPRRALLPDLVEGAQEELPQGKLPRFAFTREQLDAYGIFELQVLEKLLRETATPKETFTAVAERIAKKIEYTGKIDPPFDFLSEFYRAQRAYLEGRMLMGDKRADKTVASKRKNGSLDLTATPPESSQTPPP